MKLKINVKVVLDYRCVECGKTEQGDRTQCEEFDTPEQLQRFLNRTPSPHYMPVGWSSHYGKYHNVFKCPACNGMDNT